MVKHYGRTSLYRTGSQQRCARIFIFVGEHKRNQRLSDYIWKAPPLVQKIVSGYPTKRLQRYSLYGKSFAAIRNYSLTTFESPSQLTRTNPVRIGNKKINESRTRTVSCLLQCYKKAYGTTESWETFRLQGNAPHLFEWNPLRHLEIPYGKNVLDESFELAQSRVEMSSKPHYMKSLNNSEYDYFF